ncbi:hypothetical protein ES703_51771 [subsurface metagenome]
MFATHDEKVMGYLSRILHLVDGRIEQDEVVNKPKYPEGR